MRHLKELKKIFVRQHGEFSCGLACLAMVIRYFGGDIRQEGLRSTTGTSMQGTSMLGLHQASEKLGLNSKGYISSLKDLQTIEAPCILHVVVNRMEHFVVYFGMRRGKFIIADPGSELKALSENEVNEIWKSKALLQFKKTEKFIRKASEKKDRQQWLFGILKEDTAILSSAFILGVIIAILGLATAVFSQKLIDELIPSKNGMRLFSGISLFFLLLLGKAGIEYLRSSFLMRQARDFNIRMANAFLSKILYLPKSFFDSVKTGEIISRMSDSRRIQQTVGYIAGNVLIDILVLITSVVFLSLYSWKMSLIALSCIPFFICLVFIYNKKIVESQRSIMETQAITESFLIDTLQGVNEIKIANKQDIFRNSAAGLYQLLQEKAFGLGKLGIRYGWFSQLVSTTIMVSIIITGVSWVLDDQLKLGELMAIITVAGIIVSSSASLSVVNIRLQEAGVAFDRFYEFQKIQPEYTAEMLPTGPLRESIDSLTVKELSFRFTGRKKLFENVSLEVQKGEIVSIEGEVGSGKSTLIQVLQRHYHAESGEITVNGRPFGEYSIPAWRNLIGVVNQQVKIFNGTVEENICLEGFGKERKQLIVFCKEYGFDSYFNNLPHGLDTLLGENGVNISGGQQQLIGIARALYRRPSLLLLDEPTASMDSQTEQFIISLLREKCADTVTLLVTHRNKLANICDRRYLLDKGNLSQVK